MDAKEGGFRNGEKSERERVRERKGEWEVASMKALALINVIAKEEEKSTQETLLPSQQKLLY